MFACAFFFWRARARSPTIELLPFTDARPAWNGSYPYLTIPLINPEDGVSLNGAIKLNQPTLHHESVINESQVDLHTGMFLLRQTDLFVNDNFPLSLTRTYRPWTSYATAFGVGANHSYDIWPTGSRFPYTYIDLNLEEGRQMHFRRVSKGSGYADAVFRHEETSSEFYGALIAWNGDGWTLKFLDGAVVKFPEAYYAKNWAQGSAIEMQDASGHLVHLRRDKERNLLHLISPSGRTISFKHDNASRVIEASDDAGNVRKYSYDSTGHLETVADRSHTLYRFEYKQLFHFTGYDPYLMTAIFDGNGEKLLENTYDENGKISGQRLRSGVVYRFEYLLGRDRDIVETTVRGPEGEKRFFFHGGLLTKEETRAHKPQPH